MNAIPDALPHDGAEHRLHPLSWLFVLIAQLKQFIFPLIALLFFGGGDRNALWPLFAVAGLVVTSLAEYLTYRYRLKDDGLIVRSGWLHRSVREIPFARIHNVSLHQSLLHRWVGVAEVRLEAAGGTKPEAQMRVLTMEQALALEALVRRAGSAPDAGNTGNAGDAAQQRTAEAAPLLALSTGELIRLGLISNRGLVLVAAALGALAQMGDDLFDVLIDRWGKLAFGWVSDWVGHHVHDSMLVMSLAVLSIGVIALLLVRLLSVLLAIVQYHGFQLREDDDRIRVERGLLARSRSSAKRRRIQAWSLREGVLHRWFQRRSLRVDIAVSQQGKQQHALKELAPIATPLRCEELIRHFLPDAGWTELDWQPLHPRAWVRIALPSLVLLVIASGVLYWNVGSTGLLFLLTAPVLLWRARRMAACGGLACNGRLVAWRRGWLDKRWNFAEISKLQALRLSQSPLDRRLGTANLLLDTAGASPLGPPLHLRYLPLAQARDLSARLAVQLARNRL
ncbi:MAG: PH domain-containing protein [Pseudomonadota bacterium]|nr:PH domain-containing protein [Pseudomonadota bacterium]